MQSLYAVVRGLGASEAALAAFIPCLPLLFDGKIKLLSLLLLLMFPLRALAKRARAYRPNLIVFPLRSRKVTHEIQRDFPGRCVLEGSQLRFNGVAQPTERIL